jgi:acyl-CoA reductase-like NAD-dependent aldehyde dehydrogenase
MEGCGCDAAALTSAFSRGTNQARVRRYESVAIVGGAKLPAGGGIPPHLSEGFYLQPTAFYDVDPKSELGQGRCLVP